MVIFCSAPAGWPKLGSSSSVLPGSPATRGRRRSCSSARRPAAADRDRIGVCPTCLVLSGVHQDLGPVLEMHGVVMIPLAAPHEAVRFEHPHDLPRDLVLVADAAARIGFRPQPIV